MPITVYFATNRKLNGPADQWQSYGPEIVVPSDPAAITYAAAFVDEVGLTADTTGAITSIQEIHTGGFSGSADQDLRNPGRNLLIFLHGYANSFEAAITRAAFNREWLAASGVAAADTTVVAFSWPSLGQAISFPILWEDYRNDQTLSGQSGIHLMSFFANLLPIVTQAREAGRRVFLLAHSMGNWALQAAVESWFLHGNGDADLFDEAILAAADERFDTFEYQPDGRLGGLHRLARRISIFYSSDDLVLSLSNVVNGTKRLGQMGPRDQTDTTQFPPDIYRMVDCSEAEDYDRGFASSHQYYRRSVQVRTDIVGLM